MPYPRSREKLERIHEELVGIAEEERYDRCTDIDLVADILEELASKYDEVKNHSHSIL